MTDLLWIAATATLAAACHFIGGPGELTFLFGLSAVGQLLDKYL
jgi:hypothetical protein